MKTANLLSEDLNHVLHHTEPLFSGIRNKKVFITGGTGFFGKWLLESFIYANNTLKLNAQMHVLSRDPEAFRMSYPHLADADGIVFYQGDVRTFDFPKEQIEFVIHAATDASAQLNRNNPLLIMDTIIEGTRRVLDFSLSCRARRFLLISSGAVYGKQPVDLSHIPEDYQGAPDSTQPSSSYGEGKRLAELLCSIYHKEHGIEVVIARCFAFVGPYLNLNIHYAIGNFIRDGLAGRPICVSGDGTTLRSYLYAADLAIWLWRLLFRGKPGEAYNVGSEQAISIRDLAYEVAAYFSNSPKVIISKQPVPEAPTERYVPSTRKPRTELGLDTNIHLDEAVRKTVDWNQCLQDF